MDTLITINLRLLFHGLLSVFIFLSCTNHQVNESSLEEEAVIRQIHTDYVEGWLDMNQERIMGLLEEDARIQPNSMKPIEGKKAIAEFWFPNDNSTTVINNYTTEILSLQILDTLAYTTHQSHLDWSYEKDSTSFGMLQRGINTTVYRKQNDGSWKIWRSMWTDIYAERR